MLLFVDFQMLSVRFISFLIFPLTSISLRRLCHFDRPDTHLNLHVAGGIVRLDLVDPQFPICLLSWMFGS